MNQLSKESCRLGQLINFFSMLAVMSFAFQFSACEGDAFTKVVDVDLQTPEPLPVVFADWNNVDSFLYVFLSKTTGALQENLPETTAGARVEGFVDGVSFGVFTEVSTEIYYSNSFQFEPEEAIVYRYPRPASLQPGVSVSVRIELPDGQVLTAADRMPRINPIALEEFIEPTVDTVYFGNSGDYYLEIRGGSIKLRATDVSGQKDYYRFVLGIYQVVETTGDTVTTDSRYIFGNEEDSRWENTSEGDVYLDFGLEGQSFSIQTDLFGNFSQGDGGYFAFSESLSPTAYTFYSELQALENAEFNPFAEPVVLGSNVEGGLGHFICSSFSPIIRWQ